MVMWSPGISLKECSVCVLSHSTCVHWHSSLQEGQLHIPYVLGSLHFHGLDCIALSLSLSLSPIIKLRDKYLGVVSHKATIYHWCRKHTLTSTTLCVHIHLPTCTHIHTYTHACHMHSDTILHNHSHAVGHRLATKVSILIFIGKLPVTRGAWVIVGRVDQWWEGVMGQ